MASLIPPLNSQVEIVDSEGKPTAYFTRLLNKLTSASMAGTGLTSSGSTLALASIAAKTILANKTAGTASPTACTISDILDFISSTRGTVLFRGASSWQALAPGTAGNVLQTNGAGADPAWVTPAGGGGGSTTLGTIHPSAQFTPSVNFYLSKFIAVDQNFTINKVAFMAATATPTATFKPFVYSGTVAGVPNTLLGSGPQITGVVAGYNECPLTSSVAVTKGSFIFVGVNNTTAAIANMWHTSGGLVYFVGNGGSNTPAGTWPGGGSSSNAANQIYGFWAVA